MAMAPSALRQLNSRFRTEWLNDPRLSKHYHLYDGVCTAVENLQQSRTKLADDGVLSQKGVAEQSRAFAAKETVPVLQRAHAHIERVAANLDSRRRGLMAPKSDPKDPIGEMKRAEIRAHLKTLKAGDRISAVMADQNVASAYLDAPVFLSGGTADERDKIDELLAQKIHRVALEEIEAERDAIAVVDAAITMGLSELKRATDFDASPREFDKWLESVSEPTEKQLDQERIAADSETALGILRTLDSNTRHDIVNKMFDYTIEELERGTA